MQRTAMKKLVEWKNSPRRKPLLIQGVRRVGKTWLMKSFAGEHFRGRPHCFDFEADPGLEEIFAGFLSPAAILERLSFHSQRPIRPGDLLMLDEARASPEAVQALKLFCEPGCGLHVIPAESLPDLHSVRPGGDV